MNTLEVTGITSVCHCVNFVGLVFLSYATCRFTIFLVYLEIRMMQSFFLIVKHGCSLLVGNARVF